MPTLLRSPQTFLSENVRVLDYVSTRMYFSDYGEEELFQVRRYWQTYASRKQLIDFGARRSKIKYYFDNKAKKYYRQVGGQRKQFIPPHNIKLDITRFSQQMCLLQREWTQPLLSEQIDTQEWYNGVTRLMKYSYRAVIDVARGSVTPMTVQEEREFLRIIDEEVGKFNLYAKQIAAGDIPLDGRIMNAACSLGKRLNRIFENWKLWDARQSGFIEARRRLSHAEHCRNSETRYGCVELARQGWKPIWDITPIGDATCWDGCLCELEYR